MEYRLGLARKMYSMIDQLEDSRGPWYVQVGLVAAINFLEEIVTSLNETTVFPFGEGWEFVPASNKKMVELVNSLQN